MRNSFFFTVQNQGRTTSFSTRSIPFGWSWSPLAGHLTLGHFLTPVSHWLRVLHYIDDILLISSDGPLLRFATLDLAYQLKKAGLLIREKSVLDPTHEITWLGKR